MIISWTKWGVFLGPIPVGPDHKYLLDHIKLCFYELSNVCLLKLYSLFFIYFIFFFIIFFFFFFTFDNILIEHNLVFSKALLYFVKANIFTQ